MTTSTSNQETALVLGLSGAIGSSVAKALVLLGWTIRALTRRPADQRPRFPFPVAWRGGDALDATSGAVAAAGATLIIHGVNPPSYPLWREGGLPMLANTVAAVKATGATIPFPANVYVFSMMAPEVVDEATPRKPVTRKGQVRLEMEEMLERSARNDSVRVIAVRARDSFGPGITNSWFAQALAKGGMTAKAIQTLTPSGIGHAWAFVPDLAETFARLIDRRADLPAYTMAHFAGHRDATERAMAEAIHRTICRPGLPIRLFPWTIVWLGAPFVASLREAHELTWLWKASPALDNTRLRILIGEEPHTPPNDAVKAALAPAA